MTLRLLCIGTSPPMLMEALARARAGDRVMIVDRALYPGGAWATPAAVGFDSVEVGVHLLENRPKFHAMLQALGVQLQPDRLCFTRWRRHDFRMALARPVFHAMVALNSLVRKQPDKFLRIMGTALRSVKHDKVPFVYPSTGCADRDPRQTPDSADRSTAHSDADPART